MPRQLIADTDLLQIPLDKRPENLLCSVSFGGRRLWTFRTDRGSWDVDNATLDVKWPAAFVPYLSGYTPMAVDLRESAAARPLVSVTGDIRFDDSPLPCEPVDPASGSPLVVNKWERMAKSFEGRTGNFIERVLDSAADLVRVIKERMDIDLFVTGGTLLGPVRDGKIMHHDDDADLAYLSSHGNPADVVLESFEMEHVLDLAGYEMVRHSSGHLQVMFPGQSLADDYYVDIFSYFVCNGWFYGTFHARERADAVTILPLTTVQVNGRALPAPADPGQLLSAIYGPGWRTPDPAFSFVTPEAAARRFYWWLNHFDAFREDWEDYHRGVIASGATGHRSPFAEWVHSRIEPGSSIVELGCGLGHDARYLHEQGHQVLATDYSRPAVEHNRHLAGGKGGGPRFLLANQNAIRQMAHLTRSASLLTGPVNVVARHVVDDLHYLGRDVTLFAVKHLLARGGRAYFQLRNPASRAKDRRSTEPAGAGVFDPEEFGHRISFYQLEIESIETIAGPDASGTYLNYTVRKAEQP